ncbi:hypothetical protein HU200_020331 [Digitaria exilis]|uniref:Uncharacterized protein n=1 Tax=Digitaria exilis TaxID=1010633 RepID=A0A835F1R0_9POAL|nr:hypothetical protein HU200_020331 [Digitaria exilis]
MVNHDSLDDENPRSHTANKIGDNNREDMFILVSVNDQYKTAAFNYQSNKTATNNPPRLQRQASLITPT